jgi:hypothetical protein
MLDSKYINIRDAVEATDNDNDDALFHQTVDRLASILGFTKKREWYEAKAASPDYFPDRVFNFKDFESLDACIRGGMLFRYFEHNNHYEKDCDSLHCHQPVHPRA